MDYQEDLQTIVSIFEKHKTNGEFWVSVQTEMMTMLTSLNENPENSTENE